jgi:hypothetical protein
VQNITKLKNSKKNTRAAGKKVIEKQSQEQQQPFQSEMNTYLHENEKMLLTSKSWQHQ